MMDYYAILNLKNDCTKEDIRRSYLKLAHVHHPDKGGNPKKFIEVKDAYEYLMKNHGQTQQEQYVVIVSYQGIWYGGTSSTNTGF